MRKKKSSARYKRKISWRKGASHAPPSLKQLAQQGRKRGVAGLTRALSGSRANSMHAPGAEPFIPSASNATRLYRSRFSYSSARNLYQPDEISFRTNISICIAAKRRVHIGNWFFVVFEFGQSDFWFIFCFLTNFWLDSFRGSICQVK